jgi:hypothetical protein
MKEQLNHRPLERTPPKFSGMMGAVENRRYVNEANGWYMTHSMRLAGCLEYQITLLYGSLGTTQAKLFFRNHVPEMVHLCPKGREHIERVANLDFNTDSAEIFSTPRHDGSASVVSSSRRGGPDQRDDATARVQQAMERAKKRGLGTNSHSNLGIVDDREEWNERYGDIEFQDIIPAFITVVSKCNCQPGPAELEVWINPACMRMGVSNRISPNVRPDEVPIEWCLRLTDTYVLLVEKSSAHFKERTGFRSLTDAFIEGMAGSLKAEALREVRARIKGMDSNIKDTDQVAEAAMLAQNWHDNSALDNVQPGGKPSSGEASNPATQALRQVGDLTSSHDRRGRGNNSRDRAQDRQALATDVQPSATQTGAQPAALATTAASSGGAAAGPPSGIKPSLQEMRATFQGPQQSGSQHQG